MIYRDEEGSIAPQLIAMLLLITAVTSGVGAILSFIVPKVANAQRIAKMEGAALEIVESIERDIGSDPTPEVNSVEDPVWARDDTEEKGFKISICPLSDRINLNFARPGLFEKTELWRLFKQDQNAEKLRQFREDNGLSVAVDNYSAFFEDKDLDAYFSTYGWANINLIDEFAARSLVTDITDSEQDGETVKGYIARYLLETGTIAQPKDLNMILGAQYHDVFPFINAEPAINVNFVDPLLLREIAAYPAYGVKNPGSRCDNLLTRRESGGITSEDVLSIFGIDRTNRLSSYFGSITWFYGIRLESPQDTYVSVICRVPSDGLATTDKPIYQRLEFRREQ
jgi:hypothetical protein